MGIGVGSGEGRALEAARMAVNSPLLETSIEGASGVIFNVTGGSDMTLHEVNEAAEVVYEAVDKDANIIFGAVIDERIQGEVQITVIATGFDLKSRGLQGQAQGTALPFQGGVWSNPAQALGLEAKPSSTSTATLFNPAEEKPRPGLYDREPSSAIQEAARRLLDLPDFLGRKPSK
jgi:cell division protein FtsZ